MIRQRRPVSAHASLRWRGIGGAPFFPTREAGMGSHVLGKYYIIEGRTAGLLRKASE